MTSTFDIEESNGALKIIIKPKPPFILKFGVWFFYAIPFAFVIPTVFYAFVNFHASRIDVQFLWGLTLMTLSTIFVVAFLRRLYEKEIITVTSTSLTLAKQFLSTKKTGEFMLQEITDLKVLGRERFTDHPMDTGGFDYLGLGTAEKEMQFVVEDGRIGFTHNGAAFRFGKNVWEEDGVVIVDRINKYRGVVE